MQEQFHGDGQWQWLDDQASDDALTAANTNDASEDHPMAERLTLAGVFDVSRFEGPFGFE
jgi:hypothetical protein